MEQVIPAPRRAIARVAFVRALAKHTDAIRELRSWRLPEAAFNSERERGLREIGDGHPFFAMSFRPSGDMLIDLAGDERTREAADWARRLNVDAVWLQSWAIFALLVWNIARSCTKADCPYGCRAMRDDDNRALERVLSHEAMEAFGDPPLFFSILAAVQAEEKAGGDPASKQLTDLLPIHMRPVVKPVPGPHPLLESKDGFLRRAVKAWDEAVAALAAQGVSLSVPRKLEIHSDWLVRYQVRGETAAAIVRDLEDTDPSTVYKAVRSLAHLVELPIREA